jgi:uncharacterized glyoxalase superfamily protein PhnB
MRVMVMVKATADTEAGVMPSEEMFAEMGRFNDELVKAGVMLAGEGLKPTSRGARVRFSGETRTVVNGPFAESGELIAGYWIWQVKSLDEAIEWAKRCPNPTGVHGELELRPIYEAEDFGEALTPELRAQEERQRAEIERQAAAAAVPPVPVPNGATPYLTIRGAADAIAYYQRAFGAELLYRLDGPGGVVMHAEMRVGPAQFMLSEEQPDHQALSPKTLGGSGSTALIYVPDVDAVVARAVAEGAQVTMPVADQFWGDRSGAIIDPFGHRWMISTHREDPAPEEIERRFQALVAQGPMGC